MHPLDDLKEWLEEAGETLGGIRDHIVGEITEFLEDFKEPFFRRTSRRLGRRE